MARYVKTVTIQTEQEMHNLQSGQWFRLGQFGEAGQFMGKTRSGVCVVRYGKFTKANAKRNALQRQYALMHGAK